MFTPDSTVENVKGIYQHKQDLIICYSDKGIARYNGENFDMVSELPSWFACIFNDMFLFQTANSGNVHYFNIGNQEKTGTIEGTFHLPNAREDGKHIFIPFKGVLQEFDGDLHYVNSYTVGRAPAGIHNDKFYRLVPHLTCFSLKDNTRIWELPNEELLEEKGTLPETYFYIKNKLLIIRSRFNGDTNYLTALHADTGEIAWQLKHYIPATTFIEEDIYTFYYHDTPRLQGRWMAVNCRTGAILQEADITEELTAHSLRTGDTYLLAKEAPYLFAAGVEGKAVYAFNTETGKIDWQYVFNGAISWLTDIKLHDNKLFITDDRGNLYIFKRD